MKMTARFLSVFVDRRVARQAAFLLLAATLTSCTLFRPKARPGAATTTQAGNVTVDFQGVTGFTEAELRDALFDPLDTIQHDGLRPATADDVAFFLELFYRKSGYSFVSTNYTILGPQHLVLKVDEGPLVALGDIRFTGNDHYKDVSNFQQYIIGQTRQRFPASRKELPYVDTDVQKGTDLVQRFYLSEGYLNAQVGTPTVEFVNGRSRANLTIPIVEGGRYRFGEVSIDGDLIYPRAQVRKLIDDQIPLPYTRPRVDAMRSRLEDYYKTHGYYTAQVAVESDPALVGTAGGSVPARFTVRPGPLYRFDGVRVTGTDRLKPEYVRNRLRSLHGKVYDPKVLDEVYQELIKTGLFAQLKVDTVPQPADATLRLDVGVRESKAREFGVSLGYGTFEGAIVGFELRDRDLMGTGRPISFTVDYSTRTLSGELLYVDPHLFETDNELRIRVNALSRDLDTYKKTEEGALIQLSRTIRKRSTFSVFAQVDNVKTTAEHVQDFNLGKSSYTADILGGTVSFDLRDNPVAPTKGLITALTADVASSALGGNVNFVRGTYRLTYLQPIGKKQLLLVGFRVGVIKPFGETGGTFRVSADNDPKTPPISEGSMLPIDERFFTGGSTSVRSFSERDLGPYDRRSGYPIGGQAFTLLNVEYQFPLKLADLKGAVFVDAGNLKSRAEDVGFSNLRYAVGAGIRYNLPIGPLRLDYGVNPSPYHHGRHKESLSAFQFSFGFAF